MVNEYGYIVIEGNIGAGKTTLATMIAERYNAHLVLERFADNPFLPKFYEDPDRYSFPVELSFLADRYKQMKEELESGYLFNSFTVADYYFAKSLVFAATTLKGEEYELYRKIFYMVYSSMPKPDLFVYLHVKPERLLQNIAKRGRPFEKNIKTDYLSKLEENYFKFFKQNPDNKFLIIGVESVDFVEKTEDFENMVELIFNNKFNKGLNTLTM